MDQPNSLDDWVAVKRDIFLRAGDISFADSSKIKFLVGYNSIEQKLAITCLKGSRKASDIKPKSLACCISIQALRAIHNQLKILYPVLDGHFPANLDPPEGFLPNLIATFSTQEDVDPETCNAIELYLETAIAIAGKGMLLALLFDDENDSLSDFEENIQEFRLKGYENLVASSSRDLEDVLRRRDRAKSMKELAIIYELEDKAISDLSVAFSEKYNFQLQPFLQLREMAHNHMKQAKRCLHDPDLGNRVKAQAKKEFDEYNDQFLSTNGALQHLYQEYYRKVVEIITNQITRMKEDRQRFGKTNFDFEGGPIRLLKLQILHSQEVLKLLNTVKATKEYHRDQLKKYLKSKNVNSDKTADKKELKRDELDIINIHLEIFMEEEKLIKKRLDLLENTEDILDGDIFHDAVEDIQDSSFRDNDNSTNIDYNKSKIIDLLKEKRQSLARRRAHLRNKKATLLIEVKEEPNQVEESQYKEPIEESSPSHGHRLIKKQIYSTDEDKKREEVYKKIRQKTLQRLKSFRMKTANFDNEDNFFEEKPSNSNQKLPPYPWIDNIPISEDTPLPLPPDLHFDRNDDQNQYQDNNVINDAEHITPVLIGSSVNRYSNEDRASPSFHQSSLTPPIVCSSSSPPPPPPALIPSPPPPPPPPPPPAPFLPLSKQQRDKAFESCMEKSLRTKSLANDAGSSSTINISDILNARGKLKKCQPITKEINEASQVAQNLMYALNKIRSVRCDSDEESDNDDDIYNDFD